jgi:hypothetical protein
VRCCACRLGLRTAGAAWALTCCTATNALLLTLYQTYRDKVLLAGKPECTWRGYSMAAFKGWWQYLSLGVPAAAMICLVSPAGSGLRVLVDVPQQAQGGRCQHNMLGAFSWVISAPLHSLKHMLHIGPCGAKRQQKSPG